MASFKIEIDGVAGEVKKTLSFMGKDYAEVWTENGTNCACGLEASVERDHPDMHEEDAYIIQHLGVMDPDELLDAMLELTESERCKNV